MSRFILPTPLNYVVNRLKPKKRLQNTQNTKISTENPLISSLMGLRKKNEETTNDSKPLIAQTPKNFDYDTFIIKRRNFKIKFFNKAEPKLSSPLVRVNRDSSTIDDEILYNFTKPAETNVTRSDTYYRGSKSSNCNWADAMAYSSTEDENSGKPSKVILPEKSCPINAKIMKRFVQSEQFKNENNLPKKNNGVKIPKLDNAITIVIKLENDEFRISCIMHLHHKYKSHVQIITNMRKIMHDIWVANSFSWLFGDPENDRPIKSLVMMILDGIKQKCASEPLCYKMLFSIYVITTVLENLESTSANVNNVPSVLIEIFDNGFKMAKYDELWIKHNHIKMCISRTFTNRDIKNCIDND